jgi:class 3 adenylate cyclase
MAPSDDFEQEVNEILRQRWNVRDGQTVPETDAVILAAGAVKLTATMLYADLADSTAITMYNTSVAARLFKAYLACGSRLIRSYDGYVRSFDGDRVMGVFIGELKNTHAVQCAMRIDWVFWNVIVPKFRESYPVFADGTYTLDHGIGLDTNDVLVVRAGIRNNNDLVWVGRAANAAAKLSGIRSFPHSVYITEDVYSVMTDAAKLSNGLDMWERRVNSTCGVSTVYRTRYYFPP